MKNQLTIAAILICFIAFAADAQAPREAAVAAEHAFAARADQVGTARVFLETAAPGALVGEAGVLTGAQDAWKPRLAQPGSCLAWYPVLADAAQSGDLAYTTGPWTSGLHGRPQAAGEYVTVWRKQPDGTWKFAVNMGVERIGIAHAKVAYVPAPRLLAAAATPSTAPSYILLDLDRKFAAAELLKPGATYQEYLSAEVRLYRPGLSMMYGEAAAANMKNLDGRYFFAATGGYLAAGGDLGYVVGTVRRDAGAQHPEENGSYLRIWRREAVAGWRIVLEMFNFVPGSAPADTTAGEGARTASRLPAQRTQ